VDVGDVWCRVRRVTRPLRHPASAAAVVNKRHRCRRCRPGSGCPRSRVSSAELLPPSERSNCPPTPGGQFDSGRAQNAAISTARVALPRLHSSQAVRRLPTLVAPPATSGTMWSTWSTTPGAPAGLPQQQQRNPSRARIRKRSWAGRGSRALRVPSRAEVCTRRGGRGPRVPSPWRLDSIARRLRQTRSGALRGPPGGAVAEACLHPEPPIASNGSITRNVKGDPRTVEQRTLQASLQTFLAPASMGRWCCVGEPFVPSPP
jgi:hypothetical protein